MSALWLTTIHTHVRCEGHDHDLISCHVLCTAFCTSVFDILVNSCSKTWAVYTPWLYMNGHCGSTLHPKRSCTCFWSSGGNLSSSHCQLQLRIEFPPQLEVAFNKSGTLINVNVIIRRLLLHPLCHQTCVHRNRMEIIHLHQTNEV